MNYSTTTETIELTASQIATLMDATRVHEDEMLSTDLRRDHPIFADMTSIRTKLDEAMTRWEARVDGPAS